MKTPLPNSPNEPEDRTRMVIALVLSIAILFGFYYFYDRPRLEALQQKQIAEAQLQAQSNLPKVAKDAAAPESTVAAKEEPLVLPTEEEIEKSPEKAFDRTTRVGIVGDKLNGSINLKGARLDHLLLKGHKVAADVDAPVALLLPSNAERPFYIEGGWLAAKDGVALPDADTLWTLAPGSADKVTSGGKPVVLQWNNGQGLVFEKSFALDANYLFTLTQKVVNQTGSEMTLNSYNLVARRNVPADFGGMYILHEGPIGFLGGKEYDPSYKDLIDGDKVEVSDASGWIGITDKYWMAALIPDAKERFDARVFGSGDSNDPSSQRFQTDLVGKPRTLKPGETAEETLHVYAGVKKLSLMKDYQTRLGANNLVLGFDFGMWWFITMPFFYLLHFLTNATGSIAAAILLMTVIVRAGLFNVASKGFKSMAKMKVVSPKMKELQEKYANDKATLQMEIYQLYKREDVNPFSGCWPILIQIPIFFALYKVILLSVDLRHAPFWGWVHDLSAPDPTTVFNLFGLISWQPPAVLMIGAWPCLFCLTMIIQKRLTPPMPDPMQEKIQEYFPYIISLMLAHFSAGLVIYWTWSNVLGILQQYYILRKYGGEDTSLIRGHAARRKKKT